MMALHGDDGGGDGGDGEAASSLTLKKQWLALQRLLYCMEQPLLMPRLQPSSQHHDPHGNGENNNNNNNTSNNGGEDDLIGSIGWHSLLLRAQHCQDLWQDIQRRAEDQQQQQQQQRGIDPHTLMRVSQRVDQACRRAYEMAEIAREQEKQQQQQQQSPIKSDQISSRSPPPLPAATDLIDRIFFMEFGDTTKMNGGGDNNNQDDDDDDTCDGLLDEDFENGGDGAMESSPSDEDATVAEAEPQDNHNATKRMSTEDLQQAQREQMEEAIGLMAAQMKDATQGIQHQLQQQTQKTLTELETVAEQNVHDVTAVAQSVQDHNQRQQRRNWGTWTLLFAVAGIFCFCLVTIFTIPKRPNTCLVFCSSSRGETSMVGWLTQPLQVVSRSILRPAQSLFQEYILGDNEDDDERGGDANNKNEYDWEQLYDEDEAERKEKEKLAKLLNSLQKETKSSSSSSSSKTTTIRDEDIAATKKKVDWRKSIEEEEEDGGDDDDDDDEEEPFGGRKALKTNLPEDVGAHDGPFEGRKPVPQKDLVDSRKDDDEHEREEGEAEDDGDGDGEDDHDKDDHDEDEDEDEGRDDIHGDEDGHEDEDDDDDDDDDDEEKRDDEDEDEEDKNDDEEDLVAGRKPIDSPADDEHEVRGDLKLTQKNVAGFEKAVPKPTEKEQSENSPPLDEGDPFDDGDTFGGRKPMVSKGIDGATGTAEIRPDGTVKDTGEAETKHKVPETVKDVDMADLLASLNQAAKKTKEDDLVAKEAAAAAHRKGHKEPGESAYFAEMGTAEDVADDEAARRRVTPREIRNAADTGKIEKLRHLLELQPTFVDRQDRNGWSALHLAARSGKTESVRVLHEHRASLTLENSRGKTPLDEAIAHVGAEHPATKLLRELAGENVEESEPKTGSTSASSDPNDGPQTDESATPHGTRLPKQEAIRIALEARDDDEDLDSYVEAGRQKLEQMTMDLSGARVALPTALKSILVEEETEEDFERYVQSGRSRLGAILGTEGLQSEL